MENNVSHFVYIIECHNDSLYTGYTTDVERRYKEHQQGSSKCRYTRSFPPKRLVTYWRFDSKSLALRVESKIKKLPKHTKLALISKDVKKLIQLLEC